LKLYLVYQDINYECTNIGGVFSTKEKAINWIKSHPDKYYSYEYDEYELDIECESHTQQSQPKVIDEK